MRNGRAGAVRSAILAAQAAAFTSRLLVSYWPLARDSSTRALKPPGASSMRTRTLYPREMDDHSAHDRRPPALETARGDRVDDGRPRQKSEREYLVHRHALRQVAREVRVDASQQGQFVGEELQR